VIRVCFLTLMVVLAACSKEEPAAVPEEATGFSEVIVEATGGNPAAEAAAPAAPEAAGESSSNPNPS